MPDPTPTTPSRINLRAPDVMARVQAEVERHFHSELVEEARRRGGVLRSGDVTVRLARQFGFCYGVERAIDLAYAASKVFAGRRLFIVGEIIHNPDVNEQIASLGIRNLLDPAGNPNLSGLSPEDVVILPAFGTELETVRRVREIGCPIVDTTCGDVMSVWKRVRQNASEQVTSIVHGKVGHEETKATVSRARGDGGGHYLVVRDLAQTDAVCDFIRRGGDAPRFLEAFAGCHSEGFDPRLHLQRVGVANQTTMLRGETEEVQRRIRGAVAERDGGSEANFRYFDTICGATQERQDALLELLRHPPDLLLVVGGYNSSNTTHLFEIGEKHAPCFFIRDHRKLVSPHEILHYCPRKKKEVAAASWLPAGAVTVGITAGASCPNNLIEDVIRRVFELKNQPLPSPPNAISTCGPPAPFS